MAAIILTSLICGWTHPHNTSQSSAKPQEPHLSSGLSLWFLLCCFCVLALMQSPGQTLAPCCRGFVSWLDGPSGALSLFPGPVTAEKIPPTFPKGFWIWFLPLVCLGPSMEAVTPVGCHLAGEDPARAGVTPGSWLVPSHCSQSGAGTETPLPSSAPALTSQRCFLHPLCFGLDL